MSWSSGKGMYSRIAAIAVLAAVVIAFTIPEALTVRFAGVVPAVLGLVWLFSAHLREQKRHVQSAEAEPKAEAEQKAEAEEGEATAKELGGDREDRTRCLEGGRGGAQQDERVRRTTQSGWRESTRCRPRRM